MTQRELPLISVIVGIRNEQQFIARCVTAIMEQDYPADRFEVIVADGMSDDGTRAILAAVPGAERIRVLDNYARLQAPGLNLCLADARGDIIVRVDGHTVIAHDYLAQCVVAIQETGAWNVGGAITSFGVTAIGSAIAAASSSPFGVPGAFHGAQRPCFTDTVYMGAWPRAAIVGLGGFAPDLAINEDYELNYRIRKSGGRVFYSPAIRCRYYGRHTFRALALQYFRYGRGKVEMLARHPSSLRLRQVVAPTFVATIAVGLASSLWLSLARLGLCAVIGLYALANFAFSLKLAARHNSLALLPLVSGAFATMHLSWGTGFWYGLFKRLPLARRPYGPGSRPGSGEPKDAVTRDTA